jgi:hypothetical protein
MTPHYHDCTAGSNSFRGVFGISPKSGNLFRIAVRYLLGHVDNHI